MRLVIALLVALAALSGVAAAYDDKDCTEDCRAVRDAGKRKSVPAGGPDPTQVCFRLLMSDPHTAVTMTVHYRDGSEYRHGHARDAAINNAGNLKQLPMFCISDWRLRDAVSARICTDTNGEGGSATFREVHIKRLLAERSIPEREPACLLGIEACAQIRKEKTKGE